MKLTAGRVTAIGGLATAASLVLLMSGADAHHPEVSASASCADGQAVVRIAAISWVTDNEAHRYNSNVSVSFDGTVVGSGAFAPTTFGFTVLHNAPADGASHVVRATAVAGFGPTGEFGSEGEFRETTVVLPVDCASTATTVPPTTTVVSVTTVPSTGGSATTTTAGEVPVVVGGEVETRQPANPIVVLPKFAG